jgi:hypothetical protein
MPRARLTERLFTVAAPHSTYARTPQLRCRYEKRQRKPGGYTYTNLNERLLHRCCIHVASMLHPCCILHHACLQTCPEGGQSMSLSAGFAATTADAHTHNLMHILTTVSGKTKTAVGARRISRAWTNAGIRTACSRQVWTRTLMPMSLSESLSFFVSLLRLSVFNHS